MLNTTECPNLRDLGGIRTKNGMVKPMRLIRSGALWRISDTAALGQLSAVFDMRSENERSFIPIPLFPARTIFIFRFLKAGAGNSPKANVLLKTRWTIYLPVTTAVSKARAKG